VGSLAAIAIAVVFHFFAGWGRIAYLVLVVALTWPAIWASTITARASQHKDPGFVVVDEVLGQWVTLLGALALNWKSFALAFILFRIFDIWKPWPIRNLEVLPEGLGIVADDIGAGLYGALILYIGGRFRLY
jgi:phosphatidylglycerophosphatase A